jgi:hypothetical protein
MISFRCKSKNVKLKELRRMMIARDWGVREMEIVGQKEQIQLPDE